METHLRLYLVIWEDAVSGDDWIEFTGHVTNTVYSAGWLVEETVDTLTLACSVSDGALCAGIITIPRTSVRSMEELEAPTEESTENQEHSPGQTKH